MNEKLKTLLNNLKKPADSSAKIGLRKEWSRFTFIIKDENLQKLKLVCYWHRLSMKELLNAIISDYMEGVKDLKENSPEAPEKD